RNRFANSGWSNFSTAVFASGAVALTGTGVPSVVRPLTVLIMLKVKATSAALNGLPSFHCTLGRVFRVSVLPSDDQLYPVASIMYGFCCGLSVLKTISGSLYSASALTT